MTVLLAQQFLTPLFLRHEANGLGGEQRARWIAGLLVRIGRLHRWGGAQIDPDRCPHAENNKTIRIIRYTWRLALAAQRQDRGAQGLNGAVDLLRGRPASEREPQSSQCQRGLDTHREQHRRWFRDS